MFTYLKTLAVCSDRRSRDSSNRVKQGNPNAKLCLIIGIHQSLNGNAVL
jgi:hypothetical protein